MSDLDDNPGGLFRYRFTPALPAVPPPKPADNVTTGAPETTAESPVPVDDLPDELGAWVAMSNLDDMYQHLAIHPELVTPATSRALERLSRKAGKDSTRALIITLAWLVRRASQVGSTQAIAEHRLWDRASRLTGREPMKILAPLHRELAVAVLVYGADWLQPSRSIVEEWVTALVDYPFQDVATAVANARLQEAGATREDIDWARMWLETPTDEVLSALTTLADALTPKRLEVMTILHDAESAGHQLRREAAFRADSGTLDEAAVETALQLLELQHEPLGADALELADRLAGREQFLPIALTALEKLMEQVPRGGELFRQAALSAARVHSSNAARHAAAGQHSEALIEQRRASQLQIDVLGDRHPDTLTSLNNLANFYESEGEPRRALPLYEQCYTSMVEVLGDRHPDTLISLNNLATSYHTVGEPARALPLFEQCYATRVEVLGDLHPHTLISLNGLAASYEAVGELARALPLYEQCYATRVEVLGDRHPDTLNSLNNLATSYEAVGEPARALPLYEQCYATRVEVLGDRHPDTLISLNNLATSYHTVGEPAQALPLFEQCYATRVEVLGDRHPHTLNSLQNLATIYHRFTVGVQVRALPLYEQCYASRVEVLGDRHPDTLKGLAALLAALPTRSDRRRYLSIVLDHGRRLAYRGAYAEMEWLLRLVPHLPAALAELSIDAGDIGGAVSSLERSRGLRLQDVQMRDARQLKRFAAAHADVVVRYKEAIKRLETTEQHVELGGEASDDIEDARRDFDLALEAIRTAAPTFGETPTCEEIRKRLLSNQALVYVIPADESGGVSRAIIVTCAANPAMVELGVEWETMGARLESALRIAAGSLTVADLPTVAQLGRRSADPLDRETREYNSALNAVVSSLAAWAGTFMVEPVVEHIPDGVEELIFVPIGAAALLPLHAAVLPDGSWVGEHFDVRYLLLGAHLDNEPSLADAAAVVVAAPLFDDLPFCAVEAEGIAVLREVAIADPVVIRTRRGFARALAGAHDAHTSSHGQADPAMNEIHLVLRRAVDDPTATYPVSEARQLRAESRGEMVIAACSARTPGMEIPDEIVGFPNAFLSAGFRRVISAGWPVGDLVAALVMLRYHELRADSTTAPVHALNEAQRWVKVLTFHQAASYLEDLAGKARQRGLPDDRLTDGADRVRLEAPNAHSLVASTPAAWGAFALIGN